MKSKIYTGTIEHHRYRPVTHDLAYPIYMFAFDVDELPVLNKRFPLFGYNRLAVSAIHDKDYLETGTLPIKQKITDLLRKNGVDTPVDRIMMVSSARYFNYIFNPVSFHYCFGSDQQLAAIVAEVNNTYGERHPYVLSGGQPNADGWFATFQTQKVFHVSPFNKVEGVYHFYFSALEDHLEIKLELINGGERLMAAVLKADSMPLSRSNHLKVMLRHPFAPHLNMPRIYTHAFKLFFRKKLTFHDKPVPISEMTMKKTAPGFLESIARKLILMTLKRIKKGCLKIETPDGKTITFGNPADRQAVYLQIRDFGFFTRILFDGEIGFGEAYMYTQWDTPDLVALLKLLIENRDHLSDGNLLLSFLTRIKEKTAHDKRWNSIKNTPENIKAHYDLSNEQCILLPFPGRKDVVLLRDFQTKRGLSFHRPGTENGTDHGPGRYPRRSSRA